MAGGGQGDRQAADGLVAAAAAARRLKSSPQRNPQPATEAKSALQVGGRAAGLQVERPRGARAGSRETIAVEDSETQTSATGTRRDFLGEPVSEKVARVFGEIRRCQLARATADVFVRQALAYMKQHHVAASVAIDTLLTPSVVREAAHGLTGPLSDAALLEFARKGVMRAIEEAELAGQPMRAEDNAPSGRGSE